jgi:hypothetical protein
VNGVRSATRNIKFLTPGSTENGGWYGFFSVNLSTFCSKCGENEGFKALAGRAAGLRHTLKNVTYI